MTHTHNVSDANQAILTYPIRRYMQSLYWEWLQVQRKEKLYGKTQLTPTMTGVRCAGMAGILSAVTIVLR